MSVEHIEQLVESLAAAQAEHKVRTSIAICESILDMIREHKLRMPVTKRETILMLAALRAQLQ